MDWTLRYLTFSRSGDEPASDTCWCEAGVKHVGRVRWTDHHHSLFLFFLGFHFSRFWLLLLFFFCSRGGVLYQHVWFQVHAPSLRIHRPLA